MLLLQPKISENTRERERELPEFRLTRGLITSVNNNRADNYLKEILAFAYSVSIVNSRPKNYHWHQIFSLGSTAVLYKELS